MTQFIRRHITFSGLLLVVYSNHCLSCIVSENSTSNNGVLLKSGLRVIQSHKNGTIL